MTLKLPDWLPECAVCGRPVEGVSTLVDQDTQQIVFVFQCHGEQERVSLSHELLVSTTLSRTGRCFERLPKLPEQT